MIKEDQEDIEGGSEMFSVTEQARQQLKQMLSRKTKDPEAGLRLASNVRGKLGLSVDTERPGDKVVKQDGAKILMVTDSIAARLGEKVLDTKNTPAGIRLVIIRPKI